MKRPPTNNQDWNAGYRAGSNDASTGGTPAVAWLIILLTLLLGILAGLIIAGIPSA